MTLQEIIKLALKHAKVTYPSVLIAQALHESGLLTAKGASGLAVKYHNWFGIKGSYKGKTTPKLDTAEFIDGQWIDIKEGFRWYETDDQSFEDREDLLDSDWGRSVYSRFHQAETVEGQTLGLQGVYATDPEYSDKLLAYIKRYDLKKYDNGFNIGKGFEGEETKMAVTAADVIKHAKTYLGVNESSSRFKALIDKYNTQNPLPRGTKMSIYWEWCAAFISVIAMELEITDLIGTEISVGFFRDNHFKPKGIWLGKTKTPQHGDIITWDWDGNGWPDHIGFVDYVKNGRVYTIEGNANEAVQALNYDLNDTRIYGYARPKYGTEAVVTPGKTIEAVAKEVLNGLWGNGDNRKTRLENAGYNYDAVQKEVNKLVTELSQPTVELKSIEEIAREVINGKWFSGDKRNQEVTKAGYDYHAVQTKVNEMLQPDLTAVARDVIAGKYGNGQARMTKLKSAGYDPQIVQSKVNELL